MPLLCYVEDREGLGICPPLLGSLIPFLSTVLCEQGQPGSLALWGSIPLLAPCMVPWPAQGKVSMQPQQLLACLAPPAALCCLLGVHMLHPLLRSDGQVDADAEAGQTARGADTGVSIPPYLPDFPSGWALVWDSGKAEYTGNRGLLCSLWQGTDGDWQAEGSRAPLRSL